MNSIIMQILRVYLFIVDCGCRNISSLERVTEQTEIPYGSGRKTLNLHKFYLYRMLITLKLHKSELLLNISISNKGNFFPTKENDCYCINESSHIFRKGHAQWSQKVIFLSLYSWKCHYWFDI